MEDQVASINEYDEALTRESYVTIQDINNLKILCPQISRTQPTGLCYYSNGMQTSTLRYACRRSHYYEPLWKLLIQSNPSTNLFSTP